MIENMRAWDLYYFSIRLINAFQKENVLDNWEKALKYCEENLKKPELINMQYLQYMRAEFEPAKDILSEYRKLKKIADEMSTVKQDEIVIDRRRSLIPNLNTIEHLKQLLEISQNSRIPME